MFWSFSYTILPGNREIVFFFFFFKWECWLKIFRVEKKFYKVSLISTEQYPWQNLSSLYTHEKNTASWMSQNRRCQMMIHGLFKESWRAEPTFHSGYLRVLEGMSITQAGEQGPKCLQSWFTGSRRLVKWGRKVLHWYWCWGCLLGACDWQAPSRLVYKYEWRSMFLFFF